MVIFDKYKFETDRCDAGLPNPRAMLAGPIFYECKGELIKKGERLVCYKCGPGYFIKSGDKK